MEVEEVIVTSLINSKPESEIQMCFWSSLPDGLRQLTPCDFCENVQLGQSKHSQTDVTVKVLDRSQLTKHMFY